jgi:hypothetical protein
MRPAKQAASGQQNINRLTTTLKFSPLRLMTVGLGPEVSNVSRETSGVVDNH